jgi:hypothetical protein
MSKFKVGDRVRVKAWVSTHHPQTDLGTIVINGDAGIAVEFPDWTGGHDADLGDLEENRWWVREDNIELASPTAASSPAARFQVVYIEDEDETFDTQEEAEAHAYELARDDPGAQFAVFKRLAIARPEVKIERFA